MWGHIMGGHHYIQVIKICGSLRNLHFNHHNGCIYRICQKLIMKTKGKKIHVWMSPHMIRYAYEAISPLIYSSYVHCRQVFSCLFIDMVCQSVRSGMRGHMTMAQLQSNVSERNGPCHGCTDIIRVKFLFTGVQIIWKWNYLFNNLFSLASLCCVVLRFHYWRLGQIPYNVSPVTCVRYHMSSVTNASSHSNRRFSANLFIMYGRLGPKNQIIINKKKIM